MLTINNTLDGYLKDVEIKGNTIQDIENLADIRSVGEKVEGQELYEIPVLSCGKNLFDGQLEFGTLDSSNGNLVDSTAAFRNKNKFIKVKNGSNIIFAHISALIVIIEYDKNFQYIKSQTGQSFTLSSNTRYINFRTADTTSNYSQLQLEEGTVATEYEPYVEDKLTILSPVQLEKVGDVSDRIVENNGVWGVEKNIVTVTFDGSESWNRNPIDTNTTSNIILLLETSNIPKAISNIFIYQQQWCNGKEHFYLDVDGKSIVVEILKSRLETDTTNGFKKWLSENNLVVKYIAKSPTFIPLPHDQQVKLRTFANKTNISFLTEIEGTIKAQVPKSLGATVNTHTEQISNLNKELDRVKKLEESTVSTVETESDFTAVEATSNGYFEDVKLEGKTLVNKYLQPATNSYLAENKVVFAYHRGYIFNNVKHCYDVRGWCRTVTIVSTTGKPIYLEWLSDDGNAVSWRGVLSNSFVTKTFVLPEECSSISIGGYTKDGWTVENALSANIVILEGDHTQNPPSYFEGLKSVGDGTDEIVVSSMEKNIVKYTNKIIKSDGYACDFEGISSNDVYYHNLSDKKIRLHIKNNNTYVGNITIHPKTSIQYELSDGNVTYAVTLNSDYGWKMQEYDIDRIFAITRNNQSDKKRLLFYNEETQTWEKPILRKWDSIEKHSDGKYYYHQRSAEVVLNGSEDWVLQTSIDSFVRCGYVTSPKIKSISNTETNLVVVADKLISNKLSDTDAFEFIASGIDSSLHINIKASKLSTQDVAGFKQWLQTNNVTVVYQLAQEKVYECTNIDLITYANETNYIVESGAISPKTTLKVHNNISNVVSLLQKKVSLLESNMTKYMITQNRMQLASTYSADSVTFKVDYTLCSEEVEYNEDLYNLILNNILVGKDNYDYDKMFTMILDYASWNQISWEQFDILVGLMDIQHNPPIEEIPTDDEIVEEIPNEIM